LIGIGIEAQYYSRSVPFENVSEPHKVPQDLLHQIDLAVLAREMREDAGLTQTELPKKWPRHNP